MFKKGKIDNTQRKSSTGDVLSEKTVNPIIS